MQNVRARDGSFSVRREQRGSQALYLRLAGELDMSTTPLLEPCLQEAVSNGSSEIVVDLDGLTFMDSSALHSFLSAAQQANRTGRSFAIVRAPTLVRRILEVTQTCHLLGAAASSTTSMPTESKGA
jgi:anti-sigma B factor antagonist